MRDEAAHGHRPAVLRRRDQHQLGHRLCLHVAEVHQRPGGEADCLDPGAQIGERLALQLVARLVAGRADVFGLEHDARHAVVDQGAAHPFDLVDRVPRRQQRAARGTGGVAEFERDRRVSARHPVDPRVAAIVHHSAGRLDRRDRDLAGVLHEDRDARLVAGRLDQPALDRERAHPGKDVAAVLLVGDDRLVDEHLEEQVIDVDPFALRLADHRDFAGQRIGAAHPVDLARVGAAHHAQQERITLVMVLRQVGFEEIAALRRAAAHPHDQGGGLGHSILPLRGGGIAKR